MRDASERTEGIEAGTVIFADTTEKDSRGTSRLLSDQTGHRKMAKRKNSHSDCKAPERIRDIIKKLSAP